MKNLFVFSLLLLLSCVKKKEVQPEKTLYFPGQSNWESLPANQIGIDETELKDLKVFLEQNKTRAFLLLKDGKIVVEAYFGTEFTTNKPFGPTSNWYWASAGKTLTAFMVGLAQEQKFLSIQDRTSNYLGKKWTSLPQEKEDLITIKHQLCMTSGLDVSVPQSDCTAPSCLQYRADAGKRWEYHNAPYTLLTNVISKAVKRPFNDYFTTELRDKIGMDGAWIQLENNQVYFSTARSMARFGLLILNKGNWNGTTLMNDKTYFQQMTNTSQNLNEAYGYLWWLNGKDKTMVPGVQTVFKSWLCTRAPEKMIVAMGKNGQFLSIIPETNMVLVRMGEFSDSTPTGIDLQNKIWEKLAGIMEK